MKIWLAQHGSVPPLRIVLLSLQALSTLFISVCCLCVYTQNASGPLHCLPKHPVKCQEEDCSGWHEQRVPKWGSSLCWCCWPHIPFPVIAPSNWKACHDYQPILEVCWEITYTFSFLTGQNMLSCTVVNWEGMWDKHIWIVVPRTLSWLLTLWLSGLYGISV